MSARAQGDAGFGCVAGLSLKVNRSAVCQNFCVVKLNAVSYRVNVGSLGCRATAVTNHGYTAANPGGRNLHTGLSAAVLARESQNTR